MTKIIEEFYVIKINEMYYFDGHDDEEIEGMCLFLTREMGHAMTFDNMTWAKEVAENCNGKVLKITITEE